MKTTRNETLIKKVIECSEMLYYYKHKSDNLLNQLQNTNLRKKEEERFQTKVRLLEDLETNMY